MHLSFRPALILSALLFVLLSMLPALPAGAQSSTPSPAASSGSGSTDASSTAQGGGSGASPIPAANIVMRAETDENALSLLQMQLKRPQTAEARTALQQLANDTADARVRSRNAMDSDSQRRMRDIQPVWEELHAESTAIEKQLTQQAESLQSRIDQLNQMQKIWEATLAADETTQAPDVVQKRIQDVLKTIQDTRRSANKSRSAIFDLQSQSAKLLATITTEQALLANTLTASIESLTRQDSPAFFGPSEADQADSNNKTTGMARFKSDANVIADYLREKPGRSGLIMGFFIVLLLTLSYLRPRIDEKIAVQPALRSVRWLLTDALSVSVLASVTVALVIFPYPPSSLALLMEVFALVPAVFLLRNVVQPYLATYLYWLLAMYAFNQLPELIKLDPIFARLFFQIQLAITVVLLLGLQRNRRRKIAAAAEEQAQEDAAISSEAMPPITGEGSHAVSGNRSLKTTGYAITAVTLGSAAALVADLLGYTRLSHFISESTLSSLSWGMILFAGSLVLLSLLRLASNLRPLNRLKMLADDGAVIERRVRRVVFWVAILIWLTMSLRQTMLLTFVWDRIRSILSTELHIGQLTLSLGNTLSFLIIIWAALKVSRLVRYVLEQEVFPRISLPPGIPYALSTVINYLVLIGGLLLAIASTGISVDRFTIFASAVGVGVGFGLQSIVNNFVSGLIVLFERPIKIGDSIDMGGQSGRVRRIGIRASVLRTGAGADVIVPNSQLISTQVVNWTNADRQRRIEITIAVAYDSDPKEVIRILGEVAGEQADVLSSPVPSALFTNFGSNGMEFKLQAWTTRADRISTIRSEMCINIYAALKDAGIQVVAA